MTRAINITLPIATTRPMTSGSFIPPRSVVGPTGGTNAVVGVVLGVVEVVLVLVAGITAGLVRAVEVDVACDVTAAAVLDVTDEVYDSTKLF